MQKIILLILIVTSFVSIKAQDTIGYLQLEQKTTELYFSSQWDSLIIVGNLGLANNIDYFYLRTRLGVAYFYKENYGKAISNLEKAKTMNPSDEFTNSYLYLSYKYIGRDLDAEVVGKMLGDSLRKLELFRKTPFFSGLYLEIGANSAGSYVPEEMTKFSSNVRETSSKANALQYGFLGLTNQVTPWLSLFYGYSFLSTSSTIYTYQKAAPPLFVKKTMSDIFVKQQQFYVSSKIRIARGLNLNPYYHSINLKNDLSSISFSGDSNLLVRDYIAGLGVSKRLGNFEFGGEISKNKMNNTNHTQMMGSLAWYPLSNKNLYLVGNITSISSKKPGPSSSPTGNPSTLYFTGKIGGKLYDKVWGETAFYSGNIQNSHIGSGFVFFNTLDKYNMMANATLSILLKKVTLSLKYQYSSFTGEKESQDNAGKTNITEFKFNKQTITGGLLWKF